VCGLGRALYDHLQVLSSLQDTSSGAWQRVDATVNYGNCLSELAELSSASEAIGLLEAAVCSYSSAISLEPDALVRKLLQSSKYCKL
jgi:hypothetical protein